MIDNPRYQKLDFLINIPLHIDRIEMKFRYRNKMFTKQTTENENQQTV